MPTVTCHTEGCTNAGHPIDLTPPVDLDGNVMTVDAYQCGVCGQPITDVSDGPEPDPEVAPHD